MKTVFGDRSNDYGLFVLQQGKKAGKKLGRI